MCSTLIFSHLFRFLIFFHNHGRIFLIVFIC